MNSEKKRNIAYVFSILFFGVIVGSVISQLIGMIVPSGVVKDFFLTSHSIGWGSQSENWIELFVIRFKTGLFVDISVVSLLGMTISWYFLRYFK